jgi:hypothetical protein
MTERSPKKGDKSLMGKGSRESGSAEKIVRACSGRPVTTTGPAAEGTVKGSPYRRDWAAKKSRGSRRNQRMLRRLPRGPGGSAVLARDGAAWDGATSCMAIGKGSEAYRAVDAAAGGALLGLAPLLFSALGASRR